MNIEEFIANHYEDGEVYSDVDGIVFKNVASDTYTKRKTVTTTCVYNLVGSDEYFEVRQDSDNCGYWSEGESYDPTFRKVKPIKKMVEVTTWENAK